MTIQQQALLREIQQRYKRGETAWHLNDIALLLSLLDSDSQAAAHGPSSLLRRLKDFLFENCDHSDRDRNYDWCPSCVMGFMEVVAQPSNADSTTAMRDKCVNKVREYLTDCRDEERGIIEAIAAELSSLTLR